MDYVRFNMEKPEFPDFDKIEIDVNREENMWTLFEEFSGGNFLPVESRNF